jgi:hypothetical protein
VESELGLLDAHSFPGGHDMVGNEGYIEGPGQWKANGLLGAHALTVLQEAKGLVKIYIDKL